MLTSGIKEINEAYFNACNFESLMRGIHFAVFITALSNIYTGPDSVMQPRLRMTALVILFFLMSVAHHGAFWAYVRSAFITHGETAESIADALNSYPVWLTGTTTISNVNAVLADCLIIWRCWIVWGRSWKVTLIPAICTILTAVFTAMATYQIATSATFGDLSADWATALYSTSLVTTVYCTGMIIFRIVRIGVRSEASHALRSYRGVIEIVVESSALYCIATLLVLVAYLTSGSVSVYASAFWTSITGISPTLLIARVAGGEARPDQTWNDWNDSRQGPALSFLRFDVQSDPAAINGRTTSSNHSNIFAHDVHTAELDVDESKNNCDKLAEKSAV